MPRKIWSDGQEIVEGDLSEISSALELELLDRYLYEVGRRQTDFAFGDSFVCSNVNAVTSQVKAGHGMQTDSTQADPEPKKRQLYVASNSNVTHTAAHASLNRIDIISIKANRAVTASATRNYKDPSSGAVSPQSFNIETDWASDLLVTAGTAAGSPAVPSTPAGYIKLAEVLVTASTGISGSSAYTDKRIRYRKDSSWSAIKTVAAAYTLDLDDETVLVNATGAARTITLPPAADCYDVTTGLGKIFSIKKTDSSANAVTLQANAAELIDGVNTQVISNQYTDLTVQADGSGWNLR